METINIQLMAHINGCPDDTPAKHIVPTSMNLVGSMIVKKCGDKWAFGNGVLASVGEIVHADGKHKFVKDPYMSRWYKTDTNWFIVHEDPNYAQRVHNLLYRENEYVAEVVIPAGAKIIDGALGDVIPADTIQLLKVSE